MDERGLIRTLVRLAGGDETLTADALQAHLADAPEGSWTQAIPTLVHHRLAALVTWRLQQHGMLKLVPAGARSDLQAAYKSTFMTNTVLMHALGNVLNALYERNITPTVWKGVVLADTFYPDLGTRRMADIDFDLPLDQMDSAAEAFKVAGFLPRADLATEDAVYFGNAAGVLFDVHHRVRLFEEKGHLGLTTDIKPHRINTPRMQVLEPSAFLVHLCLHLEDHVRERGYMLGWLLDIAFVLREWGDQVDWHRMVKIAPTPDDMRIVARTLGFVQNTLNVDPPAAMQRYVDQVEPFTLEQVVRSRRTKPWGMPHWRGFARAALCSCGLREVPEEFVMPRLSDLLHAHADERAFRRRAEEPFDPAIQSPPVAATSAAAAAAA